MTFFQNIDRCAYVGISVSRSSLSFFSTFVSLRMFSGFIPWQKLFSWKMVDLKKTIFTCVFHREISRETRSTALIRSSFQEISTPCWLESPLWIYIYWCKKTKWVKVSEIVRKMNLKNIWLEKKESNFNGFLGGKCRYLMLKWRVSIRYPRERCPALTPWQVQVTQQRTATKILSQF